MIDAGILNNPRVDYALGLHVAGSLPKGYVGIGRGEISASCDDFTITLHGRGGHGSQPSLCISPIQMGIDIIQSVQNFVYNCHADGDGVVLTFGQFQAGHNPNVIPETAELKGTCGPMMKPSGTASSPRCRPSWKTSRRRTAAPSTWTSSPSRRSVSTTTASPTGSSTFYRTTVQTGSTWFP